MPCCENKAGREVESESLQHPQASPGDQEAENDPCMAQVRRDAGLCNEGQMTHDAALPQELLPRELTAENGAKAALIGEFFESYEVCADEFVRVPVTWTTIKAIWRAAVEHFESQAKATKGKAGMAVGTPDVRRSSAGTGLRVGEAVAVQPATSEIMDVTAGETAPIAVEQHGGAAKSVLSGPSETLNPRRGGTPMFAPAAKPQRDWLCSQCGEWHSDHPSQQKSAPVLAAAHNSGEGDPSATPDCTGADTRSPAASAASPNIGAARQRAFNILAKHPDCLKDDVSLNELIEDIAGLCSPAGTGNAVTADEVAAVMWESDHDGRWSEWGDGQDESRQIYRSNIETVMRHFDVRSRG
jgi:hypothetical protein